MFSKNPDNMAHRKVHAITTTFLQYTREMMAEWRMLALQHTPIGAFCGATILHWAVRLPEKFISTHFFILRCLNCIHLSYHRKMLILKVSTMYVQSALDISNSDSPNILDILSNISSFQNTHCGIFFGTHVQVWGYSFTVRITRSANNFALRVIRTF